MFYLQESNRFRFVFGLFFIFAIFIFSQNVLGANTITGFVFDKQRNPLPDIDVELLDDLYRVLPSGRTKTDSAGRYQFTGLSNGNYTVRVFAFRYDLEDQSIPVEVNSQNVRGGEGSGYYNQDFYLQPKRGGLAEAELSVVFAQEVPDGARKLYDKSLEDLSKKRTQEGITGLYEAIKIFPTYYMALYRMGKELIMMKQYKESVPYFLEAVKVNPKSGAALYYLGFALHSLGKQYNKSALTALTQAAVLTPSSIQVYYLLGKVERAEGKFAEAEKHLIQAKKLSKTGIPQILWELAKLYSDDLKKYKEAADELELFLKASKLNEDGEKEIKKIIAGLREKAKSQS